MIRLLLSVIFSRDAESRYQAAKRLYWEFPVSQNFKNILRDFILRNTTIFSSRSKASTVSLGKKLNLRLEVSGNRKMRLELARRPGDEHWVLVANPWMPNPDKSSGSTRLFAILSLMKQLDCKIVLVSMATKKQHQMEAGNDSEVLANEKMLLDHCDQVLYGREEIGGHISGYGYRYRHVFLSFPDVAYELMPLVRAYAVHATVIFDTVDLHGVRFRREAELKNDEFLHERADYYEKIEKVCIDNSDIVVAITGDEKEKILGISSDAKVEVFPNIHSVHGTQTPFHKRHDLLFIGHFLHTPNQDAVEYFVSEILPLIRQKIPGVKFTILGSSVTDNVKKLSCDYVNVVGYVKDPVKYFASHRVFVSPLRYGAGMKGKIGQSMSLGLPLVTTTIGAEGMGLVDNEHVLIDDSAEEFANSVVRLYTDEALWNKLSQRGLAHIENNYSHSVVQTALEKILEIMPAEINKITADV